jgi:hypothetical protein
MTKGAVDDARQAGGSQRWGDQVASDARRYGSGQQDKMKGVENMTRAIGQWTTQQERG